MENQETMENKMKPLETGLYNLCNNNLNKTKMENQEMNQAIETIKEMFSHLEVDGTIKDGVSFKMPGHDLYVWSDDNNTWNYELRSDYVGVIGEGYDIELEELEDEIPC